MKTDTLSVKCVWKRKDVEPFVRPAFVQDVKKRKKIIQVARIVKDVMTRKRFLSRHKNFLHEKLMSTSLM